MTVKVYLTDSNFTYDMLYTYAADGASSGAQKDCAADGERIRRGTFVRVPFGIGNRSSEAVVWETSPEPPEGIGADGKKIVIKHIAGTVDCEPLTETETELCAALRRRYLCPVGVAASAMRPVRNLRAPGKSASVETAKLAVPAEEAERIVAETKLRSIGQLNILSRLLELPGMTSETGALLRDSDANRAQLKALSNKGLLTVEKHTLTAAQAAEAELLKSAGKTPGAPMPVYAPHELNPDQRKAFDTVKAGLGDGRVHKYLLHGVTGSGKTEVYMHLIAEAVSTGLRTLVLVPEISLTPQMISLFSARFGEGIAVWHSGLSDNERYREWHRMKSGSVSVAVATRSGIFAPMEPDLLIIDEAHDGSYRSEETGLRYDTGEVAELRLAVSRRGGTLLYASATPGAALYRRAAGGELTLLELPARAGSARAPEVIVSDMRDALTAGVSAGPAYGVFGPALRAALRDNLYEGGQAMLFVGRRGYSSRLFCRECGRTMKCRRCGLPMTFHRGAGRILCGCCGNAAPAPERCPACGSGFLGYGSPGTERVCDELAALFPGERILRMDSDTVKGRDGHAAILSEFSRDRVPFLVGTQMITKGHDFPGVTLVGIVDADSQINRPEFDAGERAFQLLTQAAGRAGRGDRAGRVIIQTYNPSDPAVLYCGEGGFADFMKRELSFREQLYYPPFCSMCFLRASGIDDRKTFDFCAELADRLRAAASGIPGTSVLGPAREALPKVADRYRWQITLKAPARETLTGILERFYGNIRPKGDIRIAPVFEN